MRTAAVTGFVVGTVAALVAVMRLLDDREPLVVSYGRLMRQRQRLIDAGVPASELLVPLYPDPAEWVHG